MNSRVQSGCDMHPKESLAREMRRGRERERRREGENLARPGTRRLGRKLTTPSLFSFDVNFIATSGSSQADPSRLRIANVGSLDCRRPAKLLPSPELRYDETRDEGNVVDSCTRLSSLLYLSPSPSRTLFLLFILSRSPTFPLYPVLPSCLSSLCPTLLRRAQILIHSSSIISSPWRALSRERRRNGGNAYSFSSILAV